jgi:DNA-directed RNA polymerase subunit N (RpoN/RPB10)
VLTPDATGRLYFLASPSRLADVKLNVAGPVYCPMLTPVRCMTCGLPVGDVAAIYRVLAAARARNERARLDIHAPASAFVAPDYSTAVGDILDQLGIVFDCCRVHVFTSMVFSDHFARPPSAGFVRENANQPAGQTSGQPAV